MRVFRGTAHYAAGPCNVAIGNFDGLHLGHLAVIATLRSSAERNHLPTAVLTFEPHPREYFNPTNAPARLTTLREKLQILRQLAIDYVFVLPFNACLAQLSDQAFIEDILLRDLHARCIFVGEDFCFGHQRTGNVATLKTAGLKHGFDVASVPALTRNQQRISSTAIRYALQQGDLTTAATLLGRPYSISGKVYHGDKLGSVLGYPTANIHLKHNIPPVMGIFCVEVHGLDKPYQGVASLGVRPTVKQNAPPALEVFILDFDQSVYYRHLRIDFLKKLRDEIHFPDMPSLTAQIARDVEDSRAFFRTYTPTTAR